MSNYKSHNPTILVIFGITGDLSHRKLLPALFDLFRNNHLPPLFSIVGFSRRTMTREELEADITPSLQKVPKSTPEEISAFLNIIFYTQGFFEESAGYETLAKLLGKTDNEWRVCANKLFYLAVPPEYYKGILTNLDASGLTKPCSPEEGWTRVVVEKPFGNDLKTAEELDLLLGRLFQESQIYRIDHYLGKETVQNIIAFRFSNDFLHASWDNRSIERIDIKLHETAGAEGRGAFLDASGTLRDVGQNHLLQLLALFTMENPGAFDASAIRNARASLLASLPTFDAKNVANHTKRGQYEGYLEESGVKKDSKTETYFRITTELESPAWKGVAITLESGKKLSETKAEVVVTFKHHTPCLCPKEKHLQNTLRYQIQPDEKITLSLWVKKPGFTMMLEEKDFSFDYHTAYSDMDFSDPHVHPYRKLLLDIIDGNQTLFVSTEEIKASWRFIDPIIEAWKENATSLVSYKGGSDPSDIVQ